MASRILPPYLRPSPKVAEVLLVQHVRGDLRPALETLLGEDAVGLWATNIGRLTAVCGMPGGVAAVSQAQPGWMPVHVRVGEGGAIRCRLQTDLDTPSVEYPVQSQLRTRSTVTTTHPGAQSRHDV